MTGLILENVEKFYGSACAVTDVNLHLPEGKLVCFLGPSGCGKTTLLRMIAGLETLSSGEIRLDGEDVSHTPAHQRNFGMVFQSLALFPHMTVGENIAYPLKLRGVSKADQQARVKELLELIQLQQMVDRPVAKLSGGQRQRVAIARAIASHPKLLLLDEPLSALDAKLRESMQVEIRQLQQRLNITTILVTHDQAEALSFAYHLAVMRQGKLIQVGAPMDLYLRPRDEETALFLGDAVVIPAVVEAGWATCELGRIPVGDNTHHGATQIMLRPEQIQLSSQLPSQERPDGCLGIVTESDFGGNACMMTVKLKAAYQSANGQPTNRSLLVRCPSIHAPAVGNTVLISVAGCAHVLGNGAR